MSNLRGGDDEGHVDFEGVKRGSDGNQEIRSSDVMQKV